MPLLSSKGLAFYRLKSLGEDRHHAQNMKTRIGAHVLNALKAKEIARAVKDISRSGPNENIFFAQSILAGNGLGQSCARNVRIFVSQ